MENDLALGARLFGRLRLDQLLDSGVGWSLYLADDEERSDLVLVVVARSQESLESRLAEVGPAVRRSEVGARFVAEVSLDERHLVRFGEKLLAPDRCPPPPRSSPPDRAHPIAEGTRFAGRYTILGLLGRGGMGDVYRAQDDVLRREVALKMVRVEALAAKDEGARAQAKARLLSEARFVAALKHPHIVEIFDAGEADGLPFLVVELCERGNLRKIIDEDTVADEDRVTWLQQIAEALAYAHDRGVVHRDIKPENVLITTAGVAKLTDFGIARAFSGESALVHTTGIIGTPRYMAPEQLYGGTIDGRADQFSWALLADELISGVHPRSLDTGAPRALRRASGVPQGVYKVIERASASDPRARFATMGAVVTALASKVRAARARRALAAGLLGAGRSAGRRALAAVLAVAAVLGLFAMVATGVRALGERRRSTSSGWLLDVRTADAETVNRCAPSARPAFAAGLQLLRDASQEAAMERFDEAATKDPQCAAASLYYVVASAHNRPRRRERYHDARNLRSLLTEREVALLGVVEPSVGDPPDIKEEARRANELARTHVDDVDVRRLQERTLLQLGGYDALVSLVESTAKSQSTPIAWNEHFGALAEAYRRNPARAFAHFEQCLQASPDAGDCLYWKGLLEGSMGECPAAERTFRRLVTAMPENADASWALGQVLLTVEPDGVAARSALEHRWRNLSQSSGGGEPPEAAPLADQIRIALAAGDLAGALAHARRWAEIVSTSTVGRFRLEPLVYLIELEREVGHAGDARSLAVEGLREQRAWTGDDHVRVDALITLARLAYLTGGIDASRYRELRAEWAGRRHRTDLDVWLDGYAGLPVVGADIPSPVPPGEYAQDWYGMYPETYTRVAEQFIIDGRLDDAVRHAEAAVRSCFSYYPITTSIRAPLVLASAYDRAGDRPKACASYAEIMGRLAKAETSATRDRARDRFQELSCDNLTNLTRTQ